MVRCLDCGKPQARISLPSAGDRFDKTRSLLAMNWLIRTYAPGMARRGLTRVARRLPALPEVLGRPELRLALDALGVPRCQARIAWSGTRGAGSGRGVGTMGRGPRHGSRVRLELGCCRSWWSSPRSARRRSASLSGRFRPRRGSPCSRRCGSARALAAIPPRCATGSAQCVTEPEVGEHMLKDGGPRAVLGGRGECLCCRTRDRALIAGPGRGSPAAPAAAEDWGRRQGCGSSVN
jgi:hypothetical protein